MSSVIPFPTSPRSQGARPGMTAGASAQILILPVVRIERHAEPVAVSAAPKSPRRPLGSFFSGGGHGVR